MDRNAIADKDVALEHASADDYEKVIEILLKRNPGIDFGDKIHRNALKKSSKKLLCRIGRSAVEQDDRRQRRS